MSPDAAGHRALWTAADVGGQHHGSSPNPLKILRHFSFPTFFQKIAAHISNLVQALAEHQQQQLQNRSAADAWTGDILLTFLATGVSEPSNGRRQSDSSTASSRMTPMTAMGTADEDLLDEEEDDEEELQMD